MAPQLTTLLACAALLPAGARAAGIDPATDAVIRAAIESPAVLGAANFIAKAQFDVSADGRTVVYAVEKPDIASNTITVSLWIARIGGGAAPRKLLDLRQAATVVPANPTFSPDATRIAVTGFEQDAGLAIVSVATGAAKRLKLDEAGNVVDVEWSPVGNEIAVQIVPPPAAPPLLGVSVSTEWNGSSLTDTADRIAVVDVDTQKIVAITPANLDVTGWGGAFDWSPSGRQLTFSARPVGSREYDGKWTELFLLDKKDGVRDLVRRDGLDADPRWSPDGRFIAFLTDGGQWRWKGGPKLGLLTVGTNAVRMLADPPGAETTVYGHSWSGANLLFIGGRHMGCPLFSVAVTADRTTQLTPDDLSCYGAAKTGAAGQVLAVRQSFQHPGDLMVSASGAWKPVSVSAIEVTRSLPAAQVRAIEWPSADRKFTIHAVLVVPEDKAAGKRPLFVSIAGGPSMVTPYVYNTQAQHPPYAALLRGYAVLVPNTRGRGGYGREFNDALATEKSYLGGPFSDVMSGVDYLCQSLGIGDPQRMVLAGFSFGGSLSFYASAHTDRFKVIMASEGIVDLLGRTAQNLNFMPEVRLRALFGAADIYDPAEQLILSEMSAVKYAARVKTPLLIECGAKSLAGADCLRYFRAVKATGTPTELIAYPRTQHGIFEPALRYDSAKRQTEWIDRWVPGSLKWKPESRR